jgi:hypothetical protein
VLYLETEGVITPSEAGDGVYRIRDYGGFNERINSEKLLRASRNRLHGFVKTKSATVDWMEPFLIAGALVGKSFDPALCLRAVGGNAPADVPNDMLDELLYWDILRLGPKRRMEFTHDLLREAMLENAGDQYRATTLRDVAPKLYNEASAAPNLLREPGPDRDHLLACIASVGRQGKIAVEHVMNASEGFRKCGRHLDRAVSELLWLELSTPELGQSLVSEGPLGKLLARNPVLKYFPPGQCDAPFDEDQVFDHLRIIAEEFLASGLGERAGLGPVFQEIDYRAAQRGGAGVVVREYLRGRFNFSKDQFAAAAKHHQAAIDAIDEALPGWPEAPRQLDLNLDRLYLCQRQLGRLKDGRNTLCRLFGTSGDRMHGLPARIKIANRLGYHRLYKDPHITLRLWRRQLSLAKRLVNDPGQDLGGADDVQERVASALIGVAIMEFALEGDNGISRAEGLLIEAADIMKRIQRQSFLMRVGMMRANIALLRGDTTAARNHIGEAEILTVLMGNIRRLWRVLGVRTVVEEAVGALRHGDTDEQSRLVRELDAQTFQLLSSRLEAEHSLSPDNPPWLEQRHVLGMLNIAVRDPDVIRRSSIMSPTVKTRIITMAEGLHVGDLAPVPAHLKGFIKPVPGVGLRAMINE